MYQPDRIEPFLLHPVACVRGFAADYFHNRNFQPDDLAERAWEAVDRYGGDACTNILVGARQWDWSEDLLLRIIDELCGTGRRAANAPSTRLRRQYEFLLLNAAPTAFLTKHRARLLDCPFDAHRRAILETFFSLPEITVESLYREIIRCALDPGIVIGLKNFPYDYGRFIGAQLAAIADQRSVAEFAAVCTDNGSWNCWHALLLHEALRRRQDIDLTPIIKHLGRVGDPACDAIIFTVLAMGTSDVAARIISEAERRGGDYLMQASESLTAIKDDRVRDFCLRQLKKSRNLAVRALLYKCLVAQVDDSSVGILERAVARTDFDPSWANIPNQLLIIKIILAGDRAGKSRESRLLEEVDRQERLRSDESEMAFERYAHLDS